MDQGGLDNDVWHGYINRSSSSVHDDAGRDDVNRGDIEY